MVLGPNTEVYPIVLCTGHRDRMDVEKVKQMGIQAMIFKPLTKTELTRIVRETIDRVK